MGFVWGLVVDVCRLAYLFCAIPAKVLMLPVLFALDYLLFWYRVARFVCSRRGVLAICLVTIAAIALLFGISRHTRHAAVMLAKATGRDFVHAGTLAILTPCRYMECPKGSSMYVPWAYANGTRWYAEYCAEDPDLFWAGMYATMMSEVCTKPANPFEWALYTDNPDYLGFWFTRMRPRPAADQLTMYAQFMYASAMQTIRDAVKDEGEFYPLTLACQFEWFARALADLAARAVHHSLAGGLLGLCDGVLTWCIPEFC